MVEQVSTIWRSNHEYEKKYVFRLTRKRNMAIDSYNNRIYDFLTEPRFRLRRSILFALLIGCSLGQVYVAVIDRQSCPTFPSGLLNFACD